ncbi:Uncharacterised protein [Chromobacterium violaceum]|uniref:Uncharacterized protein n=1 Tax=Chromobacterium violaceum TaxID=536 RepID=A0A3S4HK14_CHRVL|nr:Uncharacterised protein [Chromobacterium violaceum]
MGGFASHLANTTFCWLPPDSDLTSSSASRVRMRSWAIKPSTARFSSAALTTPSRAYWSRCTRVAFSRSDMPSTNPLLLRSSGTKPRPAAMASPGAATFNSLPSSSTRPAVRRLAPNSVFRMSLRPEPISPAMPSTSPARTSKPMPAIMFSSARFSTFSLTSPGAASRFG